MSQFKAIDPRVEVNGQSILSILKGMASFQKSAVQILARHGLTDIKPDGWYNQQAFLDSFKEIYEKIGESTIHAIGLKIPESAQFPPSIKTIEDALKSIDVAYHLNHRQGEIGHYLFTKTGEKSARLVCGNPYPCDFDRGIIEAMAQRFKPADAFLVQVQHDDTKPCRKQGADSCTYNISW